MILTFWPEKIEQCLVAVAVDKMCLCCDHHSFADPKGVVHNIDLAPIGDSERCCNAGCTLAQLELRWPQLVMRSIDWEGQLFLVRWEFLCGFA